MVRYMKNDITMIVVSIEKMSQSNAGKLTDSGILLDMRDHTELAHTSGSPIA